MVFSILFLVSTLQPSRSSAIEVTPAWYYGQRTQLICWMADATMIGAFLLGHRTNDAVETIARVARVDTPLASSCLGKANIEGVAE